MLQHAKLYVFTCGHSSHTAAHRTFNNSVCCPSCGGALQGFVKCCMGCGALLKLNPFQSQTDYCVGCRRERHNARARAKIAARRAAAAAAKETTEIAADEIEQLEDYVRLPAFLFERWTNGAPFGDGDTTCKQFSKKVLSAAKAFSDRHAQSNW